MSRSVPSKSWSVLRFQLKLTVRVPLILTTLTWPHASSTISSWTRMFALSLVCAQQRNCLKSETGLVMNAMTSWKELLIIWERSVNSWLKLLEHNFRDDFLVLLIYRRKLLLRLLHTFKETVSVVNQVTPKTVKPTLQLLAQLLCLFLPEFLLKRAIICAKKSLEFANLCYL